MHFRWILGFWALGLTTGCSFVSLRSPPDSPGDARGSVREGCGGKYHPALFPLADATWVAGGAINVVRANSELEHERDPSTQSWLKVQRAFGWGSILVAAPSMIYGIIVAAECAAHKRRMTDQRHPPPSPAGRTFPIAVLDYRFGTDPKDAERVCRATGDTWLSATATKPECQSADPNSKPSLRFKFELGALDEIVVIYRPSAQYMNRLFDDLENSLRASLGDPSVPRRAINSDCAASLANCLLEGERPPGPRWHWSNGTIELSPAIDNEEPVLTIRYARADPVPSD
ncbi:MAG: hypothetical protein ACOY0T_29235 [Myxococcota bacterium]